MHKLFTTLACIFINIFSSRFFHFSLCSHCISIIHPPSFNNSRCRVKSGNISIINWIITQAIAKHKKFNLQLFQLHSCYTPQNGVKTSRIFFTNSEQVYMKIVTVKDNKLKKLIRRKLNCNLIFLLQWILIFLLKRKRLRGLLKFL